MRAFRATSRRSPGRGRRKKKPRGGALSEADKERNRTLAQVRVRVEHGIAGAKRSRVVKDVLRNRKPGISDASMEIACGLHNLRVTSRKRRSKR
jgi:DDE superfamily endonuclease